MARITWSILIGARDKVLRRGVYRVLRFAAQPVGCDSEVAVERVRSEL
jgi:very-short-patch-repair endonuclease